MFRHKGSEYLFLRVLLLPLAISALLPTILLGQVMRQDSGNAPRQQQGQNNNRRGVLSGFDALPLILRSIQDKPPASLVILDLKEVGWESQSARLLQQDPLVVLNLNILGLDASSGAGLELIQREGWTPGVPKWCLISTDGRVLYSSEQTPNSDLIMEAFKSAGLHTRLEILRQFLSLYPYHAEAKLALLGELRAVAEARTRSVLGVSGVRTSGGNAFGVGVNSLDAAATPPPELDMGVDTDIWSDYAREAENAFQAGLWKHDTTQLFGGRGGLSLLGLGGGAPVGRLFRGEGTSLVSNFAQYSPMMKILYRRWLPDIEYNLGRRPSSYHLWNFWLAVQRAAGGRDLGVIQASLVPAPDDRRTQEIPPWNIKSQWIRDCINRGDWRMAEDVARGAWENLMSQTTEQRTFGGPGQRPIGRDRLAPGFDSGIFNEAMWNYVAEPYIEILLRQMKTGVADTVVQQWFGQGGWTGAVRRASNMAKRLGLDDLGNRWEAIAPSSAQPRNRGANIL